MKCLVTGSNGFIGRALIPFLFARGHKVLGSGRGTGLGALSESHFQIKSLDNDTDWRGALAEVEVVVHLAGRAHISGGGDFDANVREFEKVNVGGTLNLARQAAELGVRRFVFISSIGVNGASRQRPFTTDDPPNPTEAYAVSKWKAEEELKKLAERTGIELVIIRPPLVYGAGAPGNFGRLIYLIKKRFPLPFGKVHNSRTFVSIDNLIDLIACCIEKDAAANQLFFAGDGEDISTTHLLRLLGESLGRPAVLLPVPVRCMERVARLLRREEIVQKICGDLQVDISKNRRLLEWEPPFSVEEGMKRVASGLQ